MQRMNSTATEALSEKYGVEITLREKPRLKFGKVG